MVVYWKIPRGRSHSNVRSVFNVLLIRAIGITMCVRFTRFVERIEMNGIFFSSLVLTDLSLRRIQAAFRAVTVIEDSKMKMK